MKRFSAPILALLGLAVTVVGCAFDPGTASGPEGTPEPVATASSDLSATRDPGAGDTGGTRDTGGTGATGGAGKVSTAPIATPPDATIRAGAPGLAMLATGAGWKSYQVSGTLLDPDTDALVASNEPIVVIDSASAIATSPLSASLKSRIAADIAALPLEEQGGTFIVRKNIDDQVIALPKGTIGTAAPLLGCSDVDKTYSRQYASATPFHYSESGQAGYFSGSANIDGTASGSVNAALVLRVKRVWIPFAGCSTYWGHLKSATLTGRGDVVADAKANGHFYAEWHKSVTVLSPVLYEDWVSIGGLPVKIKVSLPVQAGIDASARLDVNSNAHVEAHGNFNVVCTSSSCDGSKSTTFSFAQNGMPTIGLNARAKVNPWAQAGVKLELYDGVAHGQIGVRATLASDFWGYYGNTCGDANRDGINEFVEAATLDASVLIDLKAEVGFFGANKSFSWNLLNQHVAFLDLLGGSTALNPIFYADAASGYTANMRGRMRPCFPYTDTAHFRIDWTDGTPPESFDASPAMLFSRAHTFQQTGPFLRSYSPKLTALSDTRGRQLNGVATSPRLFDKVVMASF